MIYAIPNNGDSVANHFVKASQFTFVNTDNALLENALLDNVANPAAGKKSSCSDKSAAIKLISSMEADAVIIRNIGERALGKLLSAGIRVFQVGTKTSITEAINSPMLELTDPSQGRPSLNHAKKGGCCASHSSEGGCHSNGAGCGCGGGATHIHHHHHAHNHAGQHGAGKVGKGLQKGQARLGALRKLTAINEQNKQ